MSEEKRWKVEFETSSYSPTTTALDVEWRLNNGWELLHVRNVPSHTKTEPDSEIWFFRKEVADEE